MTSGADLIKTLFSRHPALRRLMDVFNPADEESRIVGGAVRNALLGLDVSEVDIATTAQPEKTMSLAARAGFKSVPTGVDHGTVTVIVDGQPFEVTTLREDIETDGRHAVVRFGRSFEADALRRDFTINALSLDISGRLHDYTNGHADIHSRSVRFIGQADQRIREDYLRILRFFRFSAAYADRVDTEGALACARERKGLLTLSRERVGHELRKLLVARHAVMALDAMQSAGLAELALPPPIDLNRFARIVDLEAEAGLKPEFARRLAALAGDHEGAVTSLQDGLRLSNQEIDMLASARAAREGWASGRSTPAMLYRFGRAASLDGLCLAAVDGVALDQIDVGDPALLAQMIETQAMPVNPFKSRHFLEKGIEPGPLLGKALRQAEQSWIDRDFPDVSEQIDAIVAEVVASLAVRETGG